MNGSELNWVLEAPGTSRSGQLKSLYNETGARRRRAHQKSRKGCANCKHRRVKCDEGRPSCAQCLERNWRCDFSVSGSRTPTKGSVSPPGSAVTPPASVKYSSSPSPELTGYSESSREWKHARVLSFLERTEVPRRSCGEPWTYRREDALELLDHFEDTTEPWLGSPYSQNMIQTHGISLGLQAPYLLHAILAYSASHLRHLHPEVKKYSIAATMHFTRSLQAYSSQLVYEVESGNANALLSASGLLAKLSFINTPVMSAEAAGSDPVPAWIRSMQGVKTIIQTPNLRRDLEEGILSVVVQHYNRPADSEAGIIDISNTQLGAVAIRVLRELCDVGTGDGVVNPYTSVMARLEQLMLTLPTHDKVDQYLAFIATLEPSFIDLLKRMEVRALIILAYWCARLSLIQQWWTGPSAKAECHRICAHLSTNNDPIVQALLRLPNSFCGFEPHAADQLPTPPSSA
ncbi:hypothetical protein LTR36_003241 [Oleoguttula mirabilis]|uniref:Zn(2)-C6 fungal-type domain-containing protein n=1 Tax=Oleoguttula mirabilis TaxID=1507867 RepID=A0AAV9JX93_9PEZI|nr:hypothetical protein LTR36_003241 [Oleoguttula mirabilis]